MVKRAVEKNRIVSRTTGIEDDVLRPFNDLQPALRISKPCQQPTVVAKSVGMIWIGA